ncbi:hypothetical protein Golomagni_07746 [Golovinomyces magnicellulatus]|nr:hypothetical protein Golomagni_07746 [Golovinomyces magnicellulatus]
MATEEAKVKLYWLSQSRSQRIVWLLEELKCNYEIELFHRDKQTLMAPPELDKVHPLGKSPVVSITPPGDASKPIVLAESGLIMEYLVEHFPEGSKLVPKKWQDGKENTIGGETEAWLRYRYYMHYAEGSLMPILVFALVLSRLKSPQVPFLARPITSIIANKIMATFIYPNAKKHLKFLEGELATSGGVYLCGDQLTVADMMMSFPVIAAKGRWDEFGPWEGGSWRTAFPNLLKYTEILESHPSYKKSIAKIEEVDGKFNPSL